MREKVLKVIAEVLNVPVEQLDDDASPETIQNWDSLKQMNLVLALEEELSLTFSDEDVLDMLSVRQIIDSAERKRNTK